MKYCKNCGKELHDAAVICPHCGVPQEKMPDPADSGSIGCGILGFLIPLVGLILYLAWKGPKPASARMAGIGALIGFLMNLFILFIF